MYNFAVCLVLAWMQVHPSVAVPLSFVHCFFRFVLRFQFVKRKIDITLFDMCVCVADRLCEWKRGSPFSLWTRASCNLSIAQRRQYYYCYYIQLDLNGVSRLTVNEQFNVFSTCVTTTAKVYCSNGVVSLCINTHVCHCSLACRTKGNNKKSE